MVQGVDARRGRRRRRAEEAGRAARQEGGGVGVVVVEGALQGATTGGDTPGYHTDGKSY